MRVRPVIAFIVAFTVVSLVVLLTFFSTPLATPGWAASLAWTDLGGPYVGPSQALAVNPNYPTDPTVLAGGNRDFGYASWSGTGLFRSLDGGLTWHDRGGPSQAGVFDVAFSPDWGNDQFAVAGLFPNVWSTADGGNTWQAISTWPGTGPFGATTVAIGPATGGSRTLLVSSVYGALSRTTDNGAHWAALTSPTGISRLAFDPIAPDTVVAVGDHGVWRSTDAGVTWTNVMTATLAYDVAFQPGHGAAFVTADGRVWHSSDGGASWALFTELSISSPGKLGVSADGAGLFVAERDRLYRYEAAAAAFVTVTANVPARYIARLAPSPTFATDQTLLIGTYDGVWISHDRGQTFTRSDGFIPLSVQKLAAAPDYATGGDLFAGGEYGVWRRSNGKWEPANGSTGGALVSSTSAIAVSPAYSQDQTVFASRTRLVSIGSELFKSQDRGATWRSVKNAAYIGQIALSPAFGVDRRAYIAADQRIQTSTDGGETWALQPFWSYTDTARLLAISPNFAANQTLYVVGNHAFASHDGGATWQKAAVPPPIFDASVPLWTPAHLAVASDDALFLAIYRYETAAPYGRHDQLWSSMDGGDHWSQITGAPDLPFAALAVAAQAGGSHTVYLSTRNDGSQNDIVIPPDIYRSLDGGATWQNLGAAPPQVDAGALLLPPGAVDTLLVGSTGVWSLAPGAAPTATPDPCQELLHNRGFEVEGIWRIPDTAYKAARTTEQHSQGAFSMRTGITVLADNKRSYSDFSQDVALPNLPGITLRWQRWPQSGPAGAALAGSALPDLLSATTLDDFYRRLETLAGDLQYAMVIAPPDGALHFLYARLDNQQAWVDAQADLSAYKGQTVRLQFGTFNDGIGDIAAQYFDTMSVRACAEPAGTPTPTATAPPPSTATPTPTATATLVFENHAWFPTIRYVEASPMPMGGDDSTLERGEPGQ